MAWNPSPDGNVAGYRLYYGAVRGNYTNVISVGLTNRGTIPNLVEGATYFFAVTAVDNIGLESDYSNDIRYTVPFRQPRLQLFISPNRQVVLRIMGQSGQAYEIQASQNLTNWSAIGIVTLNLGPTLDFVDTSASGRSVRFYRLREISRPSLQPLMSPTKQFVLRITGQPLQRYEVQATQDFISWGAVGSVTLGSSGSLDFTDPGATGKPRRFYRLREIP